MGFQHLGWSHGSFEGGENSLFIRCNLALAPWLTDVERVANKSREILQCRAKPDAMHRNLWKSFFEQNVLDLPPSGEISQTSPSPVPFLAWCWGGMKRQERTLPVLTELPCSVYTRISVQKRIFFHQQLCPELSGSGRTVGLRNLGRLPGGRGGQMGRGILRGYWMPGQDLGRETVL